MSSTAIRAWYWATGVNCACPLTSPAARGEQQPLELDLALHAALARDDRPDEATVPPLDTADEAAEDHRDPFVLERAPELHRRVRVGARRDLVEGVDERDLRPEARVGLAELEADRARADDEQRRRQVGELECAHVVEPVDVLDPLDRRDGGARAGGDEHAPGRQLVIAPPERLRNGEARRALVRVEAGRTKVLDPLRLRLAQRVLARLDPGEVDRRGADVDADPLGERVDPVRELGGDEVGLRRRAGGIRAAAAPQPVLDERRPRAILGRRLAGAVARGRAGADHDQVVVLAVHSSSLVVTASSRSSGRFRYSV